MKTLKIDKLSLKHKINVFQPQTITVAYLYIIGVICTFIQWSFMEIILFVYKWMLMKAKKTEGKTIEKIITPGVVHVRPILNP